MKSYIDALIAALFLLSLSAIVYWFLDFLITATKFLKFKMGPQTTYEIHTTATVEEINAVRWEKGKPVAP